MNAIAEVSLYPLKENFIPAIDDFIARVNSNKELRVVTNDLSTQIFGPYNMVMDLLKSEMAVTFSSGFPAVFVVKIHCPN